MSHKIQMKIFFLLQLFAEMQTAENNSKDAFFQTSNTAKETSSNCKRYFLT